MMRTLARRTTGNLLLQIGNTPLLDLSAFAHAQGVAPGVSLHAKAEWFNPGGSVKARAALRMIEDAERDGRLTPEKIIIDSSSGNTGIALAMIGAALGYPVTLVVPENVSRERKRIIGAFGAQVAYSSGLEGSDGAILRCRALIAEHPERYFKPDQYFNEMNPQAHYESTGPEIWAATEGRVTHFVAGIGTGGTIMGTGRYLKERSPRIQVIAAEPDDALAAKSACDYFYSLFHSAPVLLIFSTEFQTSSENSCLELLASCHTPVAQMVSGFSSPMGAA
jgi:cysteine synthase B